MIGETIANPMKISSSRVTFFRPRRRSFQILFIAASPALVATLRRSIRRAAEWSDYWPPECNSLRFLRGQQTVSAFRAGRTWSKTN